MKAEGVVVVSKLAGWLETRNNGKLHHARAEGHISSSSYDQLRIKECQELVETCGVS